jgi:predicted DNA-binding protein
VAKLLRFPPELETRLTALAERERRTFTAQIVLMLEQWFEDHETRKHEGQGGPPPA